MMRQVFSGMDGEFANNVHTSATTSSVSKHKCFFGCSFYCCLISNITVLFFAFFCLHTFCDCYSFHFCVLLTYCEQNSINTLVLFLLICHMAILEEFAVDGDDDST